MTGTTARINVPLTTFAQGFMQDRLAIYTLAQLLCPIVQVTAASGTYKKFDDRNSFLEVDTYRGIGGNRRRVAFDATDGTYNCKPHALSCAVDDHEVAEAGGVGIARELLDQGKVKGMLSLKATAYARRAVTTVLAALTAVSDRGNWSNDNIDPIDQLDEQLEALSTDVGSTENLSLIMSSTAWRKLRLNAKAKERLKGVKTAMKIGDLTDMLMFPVAPLITAASYTGTKRGQTTITKANVLGAYAILLYSIPNPTIYDPSAFKCFSTSSVLVDNVKTYRDEDACSDVHAVDWSEDIQQTSTVAAKLLAIT